MDINEFDPMDEAWDGTTVYKNETEIRRCFIKEFNDIYVYNLRGNQRTQGEESRREGGKIFDSGSRATIAITMLVKNPGSDHHGVIHYRDIGDYLTRDEKLDILKQAVGTDPEWTIITQDKHGDWFNQRDDSFNEYCPIGLAKNKQPEGLFSVYSLGVASGRDRWVYGYSKIAVSDQMKRMIGFFNDEVRRYSLSDQTLSPHDFVIWDDKSISWNRNQLQDVQKLRTGSYLDGKLRHIAHSQNSGCIIAISF